MGDCRTDINVGPGAALDVAVEKRLELRLGQRADFGRFGIAIFEYDQSGNAAYSELGRNVRVGVHVYLAYNRFANDVERLSNRYDTFMEEFSTILQRQVHD